MFEMSSARYSYSTLYSMLSVTTQRLPYHSLKKTSAELHYCQIADISVQQNFGYKKVSVQVPNLWTRRDKVSLRTV